MCCTWRLRTARLWILDSSTTAPIQPTRPLRLAEARVWQLVPTRATFRVVGCPAITEELGETPTEPGAAATTAPLTLPVILPASNPTPAPAHRPDHRTVITVDEHTEPLHPRGALYLQLLRQPGEAGQVQDHLDDPATGEGLAVLAGLIFGLVPALQTFREDHASALKEGGGHTSAGRSRKLISRGLVVAEIELDTPDQAFELPPWVGQEVTDDERYYNVALARAPFRTW